MHYDLEFSFYDLQKEKTVILIVNTWHQLTSNIDAKQQ